MARLEYLMARTVAAMRSDRSWTQAELAAHMRAAGIGWTTNRVTQVETLRRPLSLIETVGLCSVFRVSVQDLLAGDGDVDLKDGGSMSLSSVRGVLTCGA